MNNNFSKVQMMTQIQVVKVIPKKFKFKHKKSLIL